MSGLTHKGLFRRVSINGLSTASACDKFGTVTSALSREYQPTCGAGRVQEASPTVLVIDDDPDLRDSLGILLRSAGLTTQLFESIPDFLRSKRPEGSACLVLDVRLPGASGLEFQRELAAANIKLPIIFITGYGDIPMSVEAMKGGAVEFLTKPFRQQASRCDLPCARARSRPPRAGKGFERA